MAKSDSPPPMREPLEAAFGPSGELPTCDPSVITTVQKLLSTARGEEVPILDELVGDLNEVCMAANYAIYERGRQDNKTVSLHLSGLIENLTAANAALDEDDKVNWIGADAQNSLLRVAARKSAGKKPAKLSVKWELLEGRGLPSSPTVRLEYARFFLNEIQCWAEQSLEDFPAPSRGRPSDVACRNAIGDLAKIWERYAKNSPTISLSLDGSRRCGDFLDFCTVILRPIWYAHGLKEPAFGEFVSRHIHPRT